MKTLVRAPWRRATEFGRVAFENGRPLQIKRIKNTHLDCFIILINNKAALLLAEV